MYWLQRDHGRNYGNGSISLFVYESTLGLGTFPGMLNFRSLLKDRCFFFFKHSELKVVRHAESRGLKSWSRALGACSACTMKMVCRRASGQAGLSSQSLRWCFGFTLKQTIRRRSDSLFPFKVPGLPSGKWSSSDNNVHSFTGSGWRSLPFFNRLAELQD